MGHKVNPIGIRLGIAKDWNSKWYAGKKHFAEYLSADLKVREMLRKKLAQAGISKILIERPAKTARVTIHTARPGVVIGKKGADIEVSRRALSKMTGSDVHLNIVEIHKPGLDARLVAENNAQRMERRVAFRRAMRKGLQGAQRAGAKGVRIQVSAPSSTARAACPCTRSARTSTTASTRPARRSAASA